MVLKKFLEKLEGPEYYMETEGYDTRLAIAKINDFIETVGDATISMTYSNKDEHNSESDRELNIIRRIHTRHAIIDLNNSFDLLLQIPWFYYRMWQDFNTTGKHYNPPRLKNKTNIVRNDNNWVEKTEENCSYLKVITFLNKQGNQDLLSFENELQTFKDNYIFNSAKDFTVRTLANQMKHNHSLKLQEFYDPYDYNVNINGTPINLRKQNIAMELNSEFYNMDDPEKTKGKIRVNYWDDLHIDIEYNSGEKFLAKDYLKENKMHGLDDIYSEMIDYGNAIIDLYETLFKILQPNFSFNPLLLNKSNNKTKSYNLDKYFKS